jgi:hypothetical protein
MTLAGTCDGAGGCSPGNSFPCAPYACNSVGTACYNACSSDANCASGFHCNAGVCQ